jgi:hypothetical protein
MKNIYKLATFFVVITFFASCEEDLIIFDNTSFIQLQNATATTLVENSGTSIEVVAQLASPQATDITVNFDATGDAARYTLSASSIVIPAGDTEGSVSVSAIDDDLINGDTDVEISLATSSGLPVGIGGEGLNSVSKTITIIDDNVPCNDYVLVVLTDAFPEETTWDITDSTGAIVYSGGEDYGPASSAESRLKEYTHPVTLEDGCYTFTIYDVFADGLADGVVEGSWNLSCGALVASSGMGNFGASDATDFCVNQ